MRAWDLILEVTEILAEGQVISPNAETRWLISHALDCDQSSLVLREVSAPEHGHIMDLVARRLAGEPVQHITGYAPFRYEQVAVGPGVFIPRPETELLVDHVLNYLAQLPAGPRRVVELCAGSGAITRSLAKERGGLELYAVEISEQAWPWLQRNLDGLGVDTRLGDMATAFTHLDGTVDVVVANPPYVPAGFRPQLRPEVLRDPQIAVFSGADGLDAMRVVHQVGLRLLRDGGLLAVEHDDSHAPEVLTLLSQGFNPVTSHRDLTGCARHCLAIRGRMAG